MTRQEVYDRWYNDGFIGIDKGNEVLMIENFRSEGVWQEFMKKILSKKGLKKPNSVS